MTCEEIQQKIEQAIPHATAYVQDPLNDGQHLQALVISPAFEGLTLIKQQQMVMIGIKDIFHHIHAMGLRTLTPGKWEETRNQYGY